MQSEREVTDRRLGAGDRRLEAGERRLETGERSKLEVFFFAERKLLQKKSRSYNSLA